MLVRELSDAEIEDIVAKYDKRYGCDFIALTRALFKAAEVNPIVLESNQD